MLFIDLRKAYDVLDRDILIQKMLNDTRFPRDLIKLIARFLTLSNVIINGRKIRTTQGIQQGSCLGPALYSIYAAGLASALQAVGVEVLAYADDIVIVTDERFKLYKAIEVITKWCQANNSEVNKAKSRILISRLDRRKPEAEIT